jgi:hypothetical protein
MASFLVKLTGEPAGGTATLELVTRRGAHRIEVPTNEDEPIRRVSERLVVRLEERLGPGAVSADYAGPLIVLSGIQDVYPTFGDPGLAGREVPLTRPLQLSSMTLGLRGSAPSGSPASPDAAVLDSLATLVGGLARSGEAELKLLDSVSAAQRTFMQATRALLTGGELPLESPGGPIVSDAASTGALLDALGAHGPEMLKNLADLSSARGDLLESAKNKEAEAKDGGSPKTTGREPTGSGPGTTGGPGTGGGGAPGTQDKGAPGESPPPDQTLVRDIDKDDEHRPFTQACEIIIYYLDGLEIVIGKIGDRWYRARREFTAGIDENGDGEDDRTVPRTFDFGEDGDGDPGDPDLKDKLDRLVAERQAEAARQPDPWQETKEIASFAVSLIPIVGEVKSLLDVINGADIITGRVLSDEEKLLTVVLLALPFAGKAVGKGVRSLLGSAEREVLAGRRALSEVERQALRDAQSGLSRTRQATGTRPPRTLSNHCEIRRTYVGRQGRRAPSTACFPAGTLVHVPGHSPHPIESIEQGDLVLATNGTGVVRAQPVLGAGERAAADVVRLRIESNGSESEVTLTADHEVSTTRGWMRADELARGAELLCLAGGSARVAGVSPPGNGPARVYNLEIAVDHCFFVGAAGLLVHNGPRCPDAKSQGAAKRALEKEGVTPIPRTEPEGVVGSYGSLKGEADKLNRELQEAWEAAGNSGLRPKSQVITPNHIPSRGLMQELGVETERVGAITMTMEEHMLTSTYDQGRRPIQPYLDALKSGVPRNEVFKQALKDDIADMLRIDPVKFAKPVEDLIRFYRSEFPGLMRGFKYP